jgi:hypothetical protein
MPELNYQDEQGNKLYGFSQIQLDKLNKQVRILTIVIILLGIIALAGAGLILFWITRTHYLTRILEAILGLPF